MSLSRGAVRLCEVQEETSISSAWSSVATQLVCLFSWLLWLVGMSSRCATHHAQVLLMCDQCGSSVSRAMLIWNRDTRHNRYTIITKKLHCKFCLLTQYVAGCNLKRYQNRLKDSSFELLNFFDICSMTVTFCFFNFYV